MASTVEEKVAIVTGGGSGIGEALCLALGRNSTHVVVADIDETSATRVASAVESAGGRATVSVVDVANEQDVRHLVEQTAAAHGRLDYMFNNAGIAILGDARDLTLEHWRKVLDIDLYGVLYGVLAAYPIMARQGFGHIVNTSSGAAFFPDPGNAPYCTAKHALVGLSLSLRLEGADLGVNVSAVCPGYVQTKIYDNAVAINVPHDKAVRRPVRTVGAARAAQEILSGVARNEPLIVFPAYTRRDRRIYQRSPGKIERNLLRRMREVRKHRGLASGPGARS
ncbi:MAG TPA: SDR family oxidoreductase [Streptosporangiaceae bacterium]|nr:SDR family oxidoreductase [Streptosporangiaceae bacterium]